jgi:hypothetical protein
MDWENFIPVIMGLLAAIGIPLALRKRKKESPEKLDQFLQHLQTMGIEVEVLEKGGALEKIGVSRGYAKTSQGVIQVKERNVDYINFIAIASQYGVNYHIDYLVRSPAYIGQRRKKASLSVKKDSRFRGRIIGFEWKGDDYLSQTLNYDYRLKDRLLQVSPEELKGGINIYPEPKHEYSRIRTSYMLPSPDYLEAIDIIAGHMKSGW